MPIEFRILGPLEASVDGRLQPLGSPRQRALLGLLLVHANETLSRDRLIEELWAEAAPATVESALHVYLSRLRRLLEGAGAGGVLVREAYGYRLRVEPDQLDATRFERLVGEGSEALAAEKAGLAGERLRQALALWRGPPLADLQSERFAIAAAARLDERHLAALEQRLEADLALGRDRELIGELETLVAEHPYRERLRALLMLALYRSGRQAEALDAYQQARRTLADELGLEPGQELKELEQRILRQDPTLTVERPPKLETEPELSLAPSSAVVPPRKERKVVTVLFADLVAFTAQAERLDPETLHDVLAHYSEACADVVERHGGTIERSVGGAVMAVFGLARLHEDDALRAVRASVELQQAVLDLSGRLEPKWGRGLAVRIAVSTGEVFVGTGRGGDEFASGDPFSVAAQLGQAGAEREILLGDETYRLVAQTVRAEPLKALAVKGRAATVRAWRLHGIQPEQPSLLKLPTTPFVDRERELGELRGALARATAERACYLCTVIGPPGIGKSRLAREFLDKAGEGATVLVGRCLSYGEGITYRPLAEILRHVGGNDPQERILELLKGDDRAAWVGRLVLGAVGLAEAQGEISDIASAFRRLFVALARERPLVVVLEDAHWAEPTLLDLLEHVTGFSSGAPILLLCLSRPELLEERPAWAAPQPNRSMVVIEPLAEPESWELVDHLGSKQLPERARARIVEMGEGNPLFLEQLVAVQAEGEAVTMPSRVQAVLAARIDQLDPGDRTVLERASVEGRSFHRGALAELLPDIDRAALDAHLTRLVRKQLIRPDRPELADEEAFRFDHVLIREAAYEAIPKQVRAELHMRYAKWLTGVTSDRESEYEEILGYHLEHAYRFRHELGQLDADAFAAARRAAMLLAAAGRRARARWDVPAARGLLSRAVALLPEADRERLGLLPELGEVLGRSGDYRGELAVVQEALDGADTAGDSRTRGYALLLRGEARMHIDPEFAAEAALHEAGDALRLFEELGDERGQVQGLLTISGCHWRRGQHADQCAALERALALPTATQDERLQRTILAYLGAARLFGITPLDETIRYLESELDQAGTREPYLRIALGRAHAMRGEFESAREIIASFVAFLDEFGSTFEARQAALSTLATIEMLAGDHVAAEEYLKRAFEMLRNVGEKGILASNVTGQLAETIYAQGRYEEAERYTRIAEETAALDHEQAQITWRSVRARALAWQDRPLEGESLAREAVALAEATDNINRLGDAFMALAETLRLCARPNDAAIAAREALSLYEKKGNVVSAETARARLRELHTRLRHVTSP